MKKNKTKRHTTSKVSVGKKRVTKSAPRQSLSLTYIPIDHHIYYDGSSFRVRVRKDGKTTSISTPNKIKAIKKRDKLLKS